jgi:hypothetical protein
MNPSTPIASEALPLWLKVIGLPADFFTKPRDSLSMSARKWDLAHETVEFFNCLSLNDDEVTAQMLLVGMVERYTKDTKFSVQSILEEDPKVVAKLQAVRQLLDVLRRPELEAKRSQFSESIRHALSHYGATSREDVQGLLADTARLAVIRRDAFRAAAELRQSQFLQGSAGSAVQPQYNTVIRRWWSVDHMLAAHANIPEGVSLNLVSTPSKNDTFFCYIVRRGGNLYMLDDGHEYTHPLEGAMSRRGARRLEERANKFWFPYEWAEVQLESQSDRAPRQPSNALELLEKTHDFSQVIGSLADLPPEEMAWNALVLDLIVGRFWSPSLALPCLPLSVTATQALDQNRLLEQAAQEAHLPVVAGALPTLAPLSLTEVRDQARAEDASEVLGDTETTAHVAWLEDRYADRVQNEVINPTATTAALVLGKSASSALTVMDDQQAEVYKDKHPFHDRDGKLVELHAMNRTTFGLPETLEADRRFVARYNYAATLNALAHEEYERRKTEVKEWVDKAYRQRCEFLLSLAPAAVQGALSIEDWDPTKKQPEGLEFRAGSVTREYRSEKLRALGWTVDMNEYSTLGTTYVPTVQEPKHRFKPLCHVNKTSASQWLVFRPTNAVELAWLLGKPVSELPDVLQNLGPYTVRRGNSILDRIDPLLWALKNPWQKLNLSVCLGLSKRAVAAFSKAPVPPLDLTDLQDANRRIFIGELCPAPTRKPNRVFR